MSRINLFQKTLLDIGTGSGILSVFAALNGTKHIVAIDADPYALQFAQKNFEVNNILSENVELKFNYLTDDISDTFDIVISNLPDDPQRENLKTIHKNLHDNSIFILSLKADYDINKELPDAKILDYINGKEYNTYMVKL